MDHELNALVKLEAWLQNGEGGSVPGDLLRARGIEIPVATALDDASLPTALWIVIEALADIGVYLWGTDHLSDRELYMRFLSDVLPVETFLDPDDLYTGETFDLVGDGTDESNAIFLTYYADDEHRAHCQRELGEVLPARKPKPFDRDRLLPTMEGRLAAMSLQTVE